MDSKLLASLDEAYCAAVAGAGTLANTEVAYDHEIHKEPNAPSSLVVDPEGVSVNVRFSSDWEAVTTLDTTFLVMDLEASASQDGVEVPGSHTWGHSNHSTQ